jgi:hypothetical protein
LGNWKGTDPKIVPLMRDVTLADSSRFRSLIAGGKGKFSSIASLEIVAAWLLASHLNHLVGLLRSIANPASILTLDSGCTATSLSSGLL